jgi:hypothetical protein
MSGSRHALRLLPLNRVVREASISLQARLKIFRFGNPGIKRSARVNYSVESPSRSANEEAVSARYEMAYRYPGGGTVHVLSECVVSRTGLEPSAEPGRISEVFASAVRCALRLSALGNEWGVRRGCLTVPVSGVPRLANRRDLGHPLFSDLGEAVALKL